MKTVAHKSARSLLAVACLVLALATTVSIARAWSEADFDHRPLFAYPLPHGKDNIIGSLVTYQIRKGDTLLDVGRWFGLTATEVSQANGHMDWWLPPVGSKIVLPDEHILPDTPHVGIVLNIPEMRLYYYYPSPNVWSLRREKKSATVEHTAYDGHAKGKAKSRGRQVTPEVVYTFPVGLGRFDWRTPVGSFYVRNKTRNPTWVMPKDIYQEHVERDGYAQRVVPGGTPDNPLGYYRLALSLPMYAIHGTNTPWGVGMEVSHGCIRLYPEDIERLFHKVKVGTPGRIIYQPIKFGWRGDALYVEVHKDIYNKHPGLWNLAIKLVHSKHLESVVDYDKLESAITDMAGVPTYVMPGPPPPGSYTTEEAEKAKIRAKG